MELSSFEQRLDKISLALMSAVEAKEQSVKEFGIGEEISMTLFCWDKLHLRLMLQTRPDIQKSNHEERFDAFNNVACIARRGWNITAFTLMSEGWVSTDPLKTKGILLSDAFLEPTAPVKECITIAHIENGYITFVVRPYKYSVPRTVEWDEEIYSPGATLVRGQNGRYPNMFDRVLSTIKTEETPSDKEAFYEVLNHGILQAGFYSQMF